MANMDCLSICSSFLSPQLLLAALKKCSLSIFVLPSWLSVCSYILHYINIVLLSFLIQMCLFCVSLCMLRVKSCNFVQYVQTFQPNSSTSAMIIGTIWPLSILCHSTGLDLARWSQICRKYNLLSSFCWTLGLMLIRVTLTLIQCHRGARNQELTCQVSLKSFQLILMDFIMLLRFLNKNLFKGEDPT